MATEASPKSTVDAPAIAEPEQTTTNTEDHQDAQSKPESVKEGASDGQSTPNPDTTELGVPSTEGSINGGSDSEALKSKSNSEGHVRSSSTVKKPATFKAVSVNKKFLAAKSSSSSTANKNGATPGATSPLVTPASTTSTTSKPRLVAKSGNGLVSSSRLSASGLGSKNGNAPDGNAVWNKNRPAPIPEPKRVTDEELAQKYGIHLATRLHSDGADKQATWADIDDDDEDWAPESIEWSDGTKVTMPTQTESPRPEPAQPASVVDTKKVDKPASPGPSMTSSMKLGRGLVLNKSTSEKPTLVAKPAAPAQHKSPWAPLPPIDKTAPVITELPHQQQHSRFGNRNSHGFDSMPPPPPPTQEIAADDFSRAWRDGHSGNRELYNSQSGRYEPVNDGRRGSRNDMYSRPALLTRHHETQGPAEPSAAFQTHRDHASEVPFGRRRTSSNVSGGSGLFARRASRGQESHPIHHLQEIRRTSLAPSEEPAPRGQSPGSYAGHRGYPPTQQQWQNRPSPALSHASLAGAPGHMHQVQTPPIPQQDELELQKKIMKEARELARKRRLEEEAREEAERKERIRLKLEAMGPPPEVKKKKDTPQMEKAVPTQIQTRDTSDSKASHPKLPMGDQSGEIKQYGMMKVHPPHTVSSHPSSAEQSHSRTDGQHAADFGRGNDTRPPTSQPNSEQQTPKQNQEPSWQHNSQPSSPGRFSGWTSQSQQQTQGRNVWGPPTNDRTLGNGTFNPELAMPSSQIQGRPSPIGPPLSNRGAQYQPHPREPYGQRPAPIGPPNRQQEQRSIGAPAGWTSDIQARFANDERRHVEMEHEHGLPQHKQQPVLGDAWRSAQLGQDGRREIGRTGPNNMDLPGGPPPGWPEHATGPRLDQATDSAYTAQHTWPQNYVHGPGPVGPPPSRGSRFFPQAREAPREQPAYEPEYTRSGSPSPPPPTMWGHPVYDGDREHPHIRLPQPAAKVRLPTPAPAKQAAPAPVLAPIAPPKPISFAAAAAAAAAAPAPPVRARTPVAIPLATRSQPAAGSGWQDKINNLMGRKPSPPKSHALAVDSSSKSALDHSVNRVSATVSFPGSSAPVEEASYETKPMAEECFEEQEMGFVPVVKVPRDAPKQAWDMAAPPKALPRKFSPLDITSARELFFNPQMNAEGMIIKISFPGMDAKPLTVVHKTERRPRDNNNRRGGRGGRNTSTTYSRGGRGRGDGTANYSGGSPEHSAPSTPSAPGNGGRGGRGRGGYQGSSWTSRQAAPAASPSAANATA